MNITLMMTLIGKKQSSNIFVMEKTPVSIQKNLCVHNDWLMSLSYYFFITKADKYHATQPNKYKIPCLLIKQLLWNLCLAPQNKSSLVVKLKTIIIKQSKEFHKDTLYLIKKLAVNFLYGSCYQLSPVGDYTIDDSKPSINMPFT